LYLFMAKDLARGGFVNAESKGLNEKEEAIHGKAYHRKMAMSIYIFIVIHSNGVLGDAGKAKKRTFS